jgi:hypothetical protein
MERVVAGAVEEEPLKQLESPAPIVTAPDHPSVPSSDSRAIMTEVPAATLAVQVNDEPEMLSISALKEGVNIKTISLGTMLTHKASPHGSLELTTVKRGDRSAEPIATPSPSGHSHTESIVRALGRPGDLESDWRAL